MQSALASVERTLPFDGDALLLEQIIARVFTSRFVSSKVVLKPSAAKAVRAFMIEPQFIGPAVVM